MLSTRHARIPLDHLVAEMIAFPLASEAAFSSGITHLELPEYRQSELSGPTAGLWHRAESAFTSTMPGVSMEELYAIRDQTWFRSDLGNNDRSIPLIDNLCMVAHDFLRVDGAIARPTAPFNSLSTPGAQHSRRSDRSALRWMVLAIPEDLLRACHPTCIQPMRCDGQPAIECDWTSSHVDAMLRDHGFAETHLHIGAAFTFSWAWSELMTVLATREGKPREARLQFCGPGAAFSEGRDFAEWLLRCAVVRLVILEFLTSPRIARLYESIPLIARRLLGMDRRTSEEDTVSSCVDDLLRGSLLSPDRRPTFAHLQSIYRAISTRVFGRSRRDPLIAIVNSRNFDGNDAEVGMIRAGLQRIFNGNDVRDDCFERVLLQYTRVRNIFYRHIVLRPLTPGLQWFIRHFSRLSPAKRGANLGRLIKIGAETSGLGRGLKSFEFRTAPGSASNPSLLNDLRTLIEKCDAAHRDLATKQKENGTDFESGLVLHFVKDRGKAFSSGSSLPHGKGTTADPSLGRYGFRHEDFVRSAYRAIVLEMDPIARLIRRDPTCLNVLRGCDVCADELSVPNWAIGAIFRNVRRVATAYTGAKGCTSQRFLATAHAGEDYVHLLTGLRNVHEAVVDFQLGGGDRIGHGISLGVDPVHWSEQAGHVTLPIEVRLFDLVWTYEFLIQERLSGATDIHNLLQEVECLSWQMFGGLPIDPPGIRELIQLRSELSQFRGVIQLYDEAISERLKPARSSGHARSDGPPPRRELLRIFMTDYMTFLRGRELVWIETKSESEMLRVIQNRLRQRLTELAITIEINPSSNLLIGDMGDLRSHPLWRLRPPIPLDDGAPPLSICVGSDDPITFASSLPKEYQLLHDVLVDAGLGDDQALAWLDQVRECGLRNRFTRRRGS